MIFVPAAGDGRRFKEAGYKTPKHLLPLLGTDMITLVIESVRPLDPHGEAFVITKDWVGKTAGAVDTVLKAWTRLTYRPPGDTRPSHYPTEPLVVANCDQLVALPEDVGTWGNGLVFTFPSASSAHSYVETDRKGKITGIVEKPQNPPSDMAVSGVYAFTQAQQFIDACLAVHGQAHALSAGPTEEYISAAIAKMIEWGYTLYAVDAPTAILGTPEDYQRFRTAEQIIGSRT